MDMSTGEDPLNVGACHLVDCQVTGKLEEHSSFRFIRSYALYIIYRMQHTDDTSLRQLSIISMPLLEKGWER